MLLRELLSSIGIDKLPQELRQAEVAGVQEDSRRVRQGDLFVARGGAKTDGVLYLHQAAERGAVAAITPAGGPGVATPPLPCIPVPDPAAVASVLANLALGAPSQKMKVLAVTGTNGKTTTTFLLRHVLNQFKLRCGLVGTVEIDNGATVHESHMTTPGAVELAELLAGMRDRGCRAAALEVSSHALHQKRAAGVHFAGAAFTNLTGDHLDYHKTMDEYAAAKAVLFESLESDAVAAVKADDPWTARMVRNCHGRIIRFGFGRDADYRAADVATTSAGTHFVLHTPDGQAEVQSPLIGKHNVENLLAAAALLGEVFHLSVHQLASGLKDAIGAPGRLQAVRVGQPFAVLVDYAHTDDALRNVLTALRPLTQGKLRVLFGCGGDRDRSKRPRMAAVAQRLADAVVITSDNPRTENPSAIIGDIVAGLSPEGSAEVQVEADRRRAIETILSDCQSGDVVLIAGKGHENYQIIGTAKQHFDDVEECTRALAARAGAASRATSVAV